MIFSSITFLVYFLPLFLLVYQLSAKRYKNNVILLASVLFYAWGAPQFVFLLLASTIVDFYLVGWMSRCDKGRRKKVLLFTSIALNVGLLAYFKYANFFVENVNHVLGTFGMDHWVVSEVGLPIGISFYTFQTLTYSVDVYRGVSRPMDRLRDYLLYIMSFPQMIAGPIVRYNEIQGQIVNRRETDQKRLQGFYRFCIGLGKKVLIANPMGFQAVAILGGDLDVMGADQAWLGILAFTMQIYFDFSGYSDMAIGLGSMMGFSFPENFNNPYNSRSITEFWRRWHITLGSWMRDYLYIPLGGNRANSKWRVYFNLWVVFLISGLWHGASWNFVLWGAFHGVFLVLDRLFLQKVLDRVGVLPSVLFTFFVVMVGWALFAIEDLSRMTGYLEVMFSFTQGMDWSLEVDFIPVLCAALFFSFFGLVPVLHRVQQSVFEPVRPGLSWYLVMTLVTVPILVVSVSYVAAQGFNPFIYFRF